MKLLGEWPTKSSRHLASHALQNGEEVEVLYGRTKKPVARFSPIQKERPPRKLGTLEGIAGFTEVAGARFPWKNS